MADFRVYTGGTKFPSESFFPNSSVTTSGLNADLKLNFRIFLSNDLLEIFLFFSVFLIEFEDELPRLLLL
jgi:hypothetical protein